MTAQPALFDPLATIKGAALSDDGLYRFLLWRLWGEPPYLNWVMLNPSTADASEDDLTIVRCTGYTKREGYGGFYVFNLFPYRATRPSDLWKAEKPVGPPDSNGRYGSDNDWRINNAALNGKDWVLAWGANAVRCYERKVAIKRILRHRDCRLFHLGLTKQGEPRHPLMVRADQPLIAVTKEVSA